MRQFSSDTINRILLLAFSLGGIGTGSYVIYDMFNRKDSWEVTIEGKAPSSYKEDIKKTILYLLKTTKKNITAHDIRSLLKLDIRVKAVKEIKITSDKKIFLRIQMREGASILHLQKNNKILETDRDSIVLGEGIENIEKISSEIPIIYLTKQGLSDRWSILGKRDIMQSYMATKEDLPFVWQRIAEISIGENNYLYTIYTSQIRSKIQTNEKFNRSLLLKLWALFFYMERQFKNKWTKVKLNLYNAQIQEL